MKTQSSRNVKLLAQHPLNGFGNCGEGMAIQRCRDGRRILWIAHESAPKNVTAVDVTNPKKPAMVTQTDLPHDRMRSNSLDLVGDLLVVAYQTSSPGLKPAGFEIFDVADPASRARSRSSTRPAPPRAACITCGGWMVSTCIAARAPPTSRRATAATISSIASWTCASS